VREKNVTSKRGSNAAFSSSRSSLEESSPSSPSSLQPASAAASTGEEDGAAAGGEARTRARIELQRQEDQRRQIQDALNRQTYSQFRAYASQQFPGSPDQQGLLIRQLQEQHYYQYMQQIYQQQMESHAAETLAEHAKEEQPDGLVEGVANLNVRDEHQAEAGVEEEEDDDDEHVDEEENVEESEWMRLLSV